MLNQNETLSEKFIKRGFWLYFFSLLTGPIGYIVKIILSNDLKVEEIGIFYGIISLITLLSTYHDLGLTESLNYFLPKFIANKDYSRFKSVVIYAIFAQIPTSIIIGLGLYFGAGFLAEHYFNAKELVLETKSVLQIFCLFFIGFNLFQITNTIFGATQNTKLQKGTEFIRMLSILGFTVGFWVLDIGTLVNYAWNWIIGLAFGIIVSYAIFYKKYYLPYLKNAKIIFDKNLIKQLFSYAFWVLIAVNISTILGQLDMQLIIYILGPKDAGYYSNYLSIIGIPFLLIAPIIGFLFPVISGLHSTNNIEKIKTIKTMFYKYFSVIAVVTSIFMFVFGPQIAVILFGEKFRFSGIILQYSVFFLIFNLLLHINFQILAGSGKIKDRVKILLAGLGINFVLNIILINLFKESGLGAAGSSLAVGLSWIPIFLMSHKVTSEYSGKFDFKFFFKNLFIVIFLNVLLYFYTVPFFINLNRPKSLLLFLVIGFVYVTIIALFNLKELRLFISELKKIKKIG